MTLLYTFRVTTRLPSAMHIISSVSSQALWCTSCHLLVVFLQYCWHLKLKFKLGLTVHRCVSNKAPHYLADSCKLVSNITSQRRLRSAHRRHLDVPRYNCSTLGRWSFSVADPTVWNLLPDDLRDQGCTESTFKQSLKTYLFAQH